MLSSLLEHVGSQEKFEIDPRTEVDFEFIVPWFGEFGFKSIPATYWVQMSLVSDPCFSNRLPLRSPLLIFRVACLIGRLSAAFDWVYFQCHQWGNHIFLHNQKEGIFHGSPDCLRYRNTVIARIPHVPRTGSGYSQYRVHFCLGRNGAFDFIPLL
jgi:hypothetical protein